VKPDNILTRDNYGRAAYIDSTGKGVGYGSPLADNSGCQIEVPNSPCQVQNRNLWQAQPGFWYRFYKGTSGTMQLGVAAKGFAPIAIRVSVADINHMQLAGCHKLGKILTRRHELSFHIKGGAGDPQLI